MLPSRTPAGPIWRLARKPNPWLPIDWAYSHHGTFGNRFDDPEGMYRVLYAASDPLGCYLETLASFRPDLTLLAELGEIEGENDFVPLGVVPLDWQRKRLLGSAIVDGEYADIYSAEWIGEMRPRLAGECLRLGLQDLDLSVLQNASPRRLTQLCSRLVYRKQFAGIRYQSRYGNDLENWALFEPFQIRREIEISEINPQDPLLQRACEILSIQFEASSSRQS